MGSRSIALDDARQGDPRMGSRSSLRRTLAQGGDIEGGRVKVNLSSDDGAEARELVRGLVEEIRLMPEDGRLRIEVRGELGAILRLAEGARATGAGASVLPGS
jgi:hypothetical protein